MSKFSKLFGEDNLPTEKWYRLDNSAVIYPISITSTTQSLFRLSAEMRDYVDGESLAVAAKAVLERFPGFAVQLRSGVFRHYFDDNDYPPAVREDNGLLFQKIDFNRNNRYLFRLTYYKRRIFIDFFHALCDASGGMEFFKALIYQYLVEQGLNPTSHEGIKIVGENPVEGETEDAFLRYYKEFNLFGGVIGKMAGKDAFQIGGKRFKRVGYGLIQGSLPTDKLLALAKSYDCTVTVLIAALALLSVAETQTKAPLDKDLVAMIPVDLRRIFPSATLKNFTTVARVAVNPQKTPRTLPDFIAVIKENLANELNEAALREKLSATTILGIKWYLRILPLSIKSFFIKTGKLVSIHTKQTMIISNLGVVKLPDDVAACVKEIAFNPNVSHKVPINMGVVSYGGKTVVSFTRQLIATDIERAFFRRLSNEGFSAEDIEIISNFREK